MRRNVVRILNVILVVVMMFGLFACGGGGGGGSNPPPPTNVAPTANAGPDQIVDEHTTVTLFGSGSDSDGSISSYSWGQINGLPVVLNNANTATVTFTAPDVRRLEILIFQLTVTDDDGASSTHMVAITVISVNDTPKTSATWSKDKSAAIMADVDGNIMVNNLDSNTIAWITPNGESFTIYYGDDSLPSKVVYENYVLLYEDWTVDSVDIAVVSLAGYTITKDVPIDSRLISELLRFSSLGKVNYSMVTAFSNSVTTSKAFSNLPYLGAALKLKGVILRVAVCGGGVAMAVGSAGALSGVVVMACGSLVIEALSVVTENDTVDDLSTGMGIVNALIPCTSSLFECSVSIIEVGAEFFIEAESTQAELEYQITTAMSELLDDCGDEECGLGIPYLDVTNISSNQILIEWAGPGDEENLEIKIFYPTLTNPREEETHIFPKGSGSVTGTLPLDGREWEVWLRALLGEEHSEWAKVSGVSPGGEPSNEVVIDTTTGLMWQDNGYEAQHDWYDAEDYCEDLSLGGFSGWRLPSVGELEGLYDRRDILSSYVSSDYWSSSSTCINCWVWLIDFYNGYKPLYSRTTNHHVRCVRDGE